MRVLAPLLFAGVVLAQDAPHLAREAPPAAKVSVGEAIKSGVAFLIANQNKNGSFGARTDGRIWGITASVPGAHHAFQVATTGLCWMGLDETGDRSEACRTAKRKALRWLVDHARAKRSRPWELYNTWSQAYGLQALSQALRTKQFEGVPEKEVRAAAEELIKAIGKYQTPDGGWGYYDFRYKAAKPEWSTSFSTATMLVALHEAEAAGLKVPSGIVDRACVNVQRCRKPDATYLYGLYARYWPNGGVNKAAGSSMRDPACTLALRLFGRDVDAGDVGTIFERLVKQHRFAVAGVRRPIPHESWYQVSGYFYLYGHLYASMLTTHLTAESRPFYARKIADFVLKTRQPDGSFWDYPLYGYHKFYGTGYALMTLARCKRALAEAEE